MGLGEARVLPAGVTVTSEKRVVYILFNVTFALIYFCNMDYFLFFFF